jgi:molecular chaperone DnaJ
MAAGGARFSAGAGATGGAGGFEDVFSSMFGGGGAGTRVRYTQPGAGGAQAFNLDDLLGAFGGGGGGGFGGFGAGRAQGPAAGADLHASVTLPFREAATGSTQVLSIDGKSMTVRIPAGVRDGQRIKLAGKGEPSHNGGPPGNLVIAVKVPAHPVFSLDGNNLRLTLPVTFTEAALGARIDVPTLDGGHVTVKVPAGTAPGKTLRVKGKGITTTKGTGDMLVTINLVVPVRVGGKVKDALEALREATRDEDPRRDLRKLAAN